MRPRPQENIMKISFTRQDKTPVKAGGVGLFIEDINYAVDGGLYAEMLENRNFEAKEVSGKWDNYAVKPDGGYAWEAYPAGASTQMKIKTDRPLFPENPHYMRFTAAAGEGMKNRAYDGIYLRRGAEYKISFWMRAYDYRGKALAGVFKDGVPLFKKKFKARPDGKWHHYTCRFKCKVEAERADFVFELLGAGMVHLDCFSMMPCDAIFGVFRRDLAELMKDLKPGFLRFPGGCVVEGNGLENRYLWKESVGQKERRRHNWNRWAVERAGDAEELRCPFPHYGQTLGIGFYEYFRLAEYLGAKPLPVLSVGIACQYMSTEFVPLGDPALETYIQDALDLVEFANGGPETMWGKLRADLGHPAPFGLEYLALGNEQWVAKPVQKDTNMPASNEFYKRFELFEERIHAVYPAIKIVGTAGPSFGTESYRSAWDWTREKLRENANFVYCTDEHFYVTPQWLYDHANVYDGYPRGPLVYVGEFAAHVNIPGKTLFKTPAANCWGSALAEAAFMTGMERNSDVVVMRSYAPLLGRLGYTQWSPNLIWFDGKAAYGSANYHVQKLYSLYTGDFALKTAADMPHIYASATERDGFTFVKVANATEETVDAEVEADHDFGSLTRIICLTGGALDYNTPEEPDKIVPQEIAPTAPRAVRLSPRSFYVLVFRK